MNCFRSKRTILVLTIFFNADAAAALILLLTMMMVVVVGVLAVLDVVEVVGNTEEVPGCGTLSTHGDMT